jgi:hypothetical protein
MAAGKVGLSLEYDYLEAGATIAITGTVNIVNGKLMLWEAPPWAAST